jgi:TRAP-type mannitol/chloroaromatic compound transport system substrate-binding protein
LYKGQIWDVKNEFFWMSKNEMMDIANDCNYTNLYNDARTSSDRFVYEVLFGNDRVYDKLSNDAKLVIDKASELVKKSMSVREEFSNHENHLDSWDAGYSQLKLIWKEYFSEDFKDFRDSYKKMEERLKPLVYELGFLIK